jgi:hypothetical protein
LIRRTSNASPIVHRMKFVSAMMVVKPGVRPSPPVGCPQLLNKPVTRYTRAVHPP